MGPMTTAKKFAARAIHTEGDGRQGRFITEVDDQHKRDVMVIGPNVAESLFPQQPNIVGNYVDLAGHPFEIIGVLEKRQNSFFGENEEDNALFVPYETGRKLSPISKELNLHIRAKTGMLQAGLDQVEEVLRRQRGIKYDQPNNFQLQTASKIIEQFDGITMYVGLFAIAISAVGLLVGGIGVMNIMLVSVTERTREIGIRKSLGARRKDILRQFLVESTIQAMVGGAIGVSIAWALGKLVSTLTPIPTSLPLLAVVVALSVSGGVGLIAGVYPAWRAAGLDPVTAMRAD